MTLWRRLSILLAMIALAAPPLAVAHDEAPSGAAEVTNPIQKLVQERQYQKAIERVQQMRVEASKPLADADSEYWASRAESALKLTDSARERLRAIARTYPGTERGTAAAIEVTTTLLNTIAEGVAKTPADLKLATDCAKELEATATKLTIPDGISRAWYVAGNAWRVAKQDAPATSAYEKSAAVPGATDYPAKALYSLSTRKLQALDVAGARKLLDNCLKQYPKSSGADKCGKAISRLALIGTPAAELDVETWINGPPQTIAALKGRVVLVWFFATWCPHCKATMPEMAALKERFAGKPLTIIGITNNSRGQTTEMAAALASDPQWGITYPAAVDHDATTSLAYQGTGVPAAVLVDKKGVVRWADHPTYITDAMIQRLLAE